MHYLVNVNVIDQINMSLKPDGEIPKNKQMHVHYDSYE